MVKGAAEAGLVASFQRNGKTVPHSPRLGTAEQAAAGDPLCDRPTDALVGGSFVSLQLPVRDPAQPAERGVSFLGPSASRAGRSDLNTFNLANTGLHFAFFLEKRKSGMVPR